MEYRKYYFTKTQWKTAKGKITAEEGYTDEVACVVELGHPIKTPAVYDDEGNETKAAVMDTKLEVDILWAGEPRTTSFASYEVWPDPCGRHIIAGWERAYTETLYTKFPDRKPDETIEH